VIIEQSVCCSIPIEGGCTLTCTARGWGNLKYRWERHTENDWTFVGIEKTYTTTNPGIYRCVVTNTAGSVESDNIEVTVKG